MEELGSELKVYQSALVPPPPIFFYFAHPPRNKIENKMPTETCLHDTSTGKCYESTTLFLPDCHLRRIALPAYIT